jgi:DNA (cytosine-5)-methyltransferase 1
LPAKTIKAGGHGVTGGENMMRLHEGTVRYFNLFEGKRIQTFHDDYQTTGAWTRAPRLWPPHLIRLHPISAR